MSVDPQFLAFKRNFPVLTTCTKANWWCADNGNLAMESKDKFNKSRWQKIQHFFGWGPAGFFTICSAIDKISNDCFDKIAKPAQDRLTSIRDRGVSNLAKEQLKDATELLLKLAEIQELTRELKKAVWNRFFPKHNCLFYVSFTIQVVAEAILGLPKFIFKMFSSADEGVKRSNFYANAFLSECLNAYLRKIGPVAIWEDEKSGLSLNVETDLKGHWLTVKQKDTSSFLARVAFHLEGSPDNLKMIITEMSGSDASAGALLALYLNKIAGEKVKINCEDEIERKLFGSARYAKLPEYPHSKCPQISDELVRLDAILSTANQVFPDGITSICSFQNLFDAARELSPNAEESKSNGLHVDLTETTELP